MKELLRKEQRAKRAMNIHKHTKPVTCIDFVDLSKVARTLIGSLTFDNSKVLTSLGAAGPLRRHVGRRRKNYLLGPLGGSDLG